MHCGLPDGGAGFASSWAAVLGHAAHHAGAMMNPGDAHQHAAAFPGGPHHPHHQGGVPMDLHVPHSFQYYR